jgi:hypothetical protein
MIICLVVIRAGLSCHRRKSKAIIYTLLHSVAVLDLRPSRLSNRGTSSICASAVVVQPFMERAILVGRKSSPNASSRQLLPFIDQTKAGYT